MLVKVIPDTVIFEIDGGTSIPRATETPATSGGFRVQGVAVTTFENPELHELYLQDLGSLWDAARIAEVKPGTIRVWESRGKIERVRLHGGQPLYHLPTVKTAAQVPPGRPARAA